MSEWNLRDFGSATRSSVAPDFAAKIFSRCGLDRYTVAQSALGDAYVAWTASGVSALRLAQDEHSFEAWYGERFGRRCVRALEEDPTSSAARAKLRGEDLTVPLDLSGCSPFERRVLGHAAQIPPRHPRPSCSPPPPPRR